MPAQDINDGFTLPGYIRAKVPVYPAVRFRYRPIPSNERVRLYDNFKNLTEQQQAQRVAEIMARKVLSWDLKHPTGTELNCHDAATYRGLWSFDLYNRLQEIVFEVGESDPDPAAEPTPDESDHAETGEGN